MKILLLAGLRSVVALDFLWDLDITCKINHRDVIIYVHKEK